MVNRGPRYIFRVSVKGKSEIKEQRVKGSFNYYWDNDFISYESSIRKFSSYISNVSAKRRKKREESEQIEIARATEHSISMQYIE